MQRGLLGAILNLLQCTHSILLLVTPSNHSDYGLRIVPELSRFMIGYPWLYFGIFLSVSLIVDGGYSLNCEVSSFVAFSYQWLPLVTPF